MPTIKIYGCSVLGNLGKGDISHCNHLQSPVCKSSLDSHRFCLLDGSENLHIAVVWLAVLIQLIANHSAIALSHTIGSMAQSPTNSGPLPPIPRTTLPSWMPPVGFHSCSMPGANSQSQLITEFLMECFPSE